MIRARAEAVKNIKTAAEERLDMVSIDQIKYELGQYIQPLEEMENSLGRAGKQARIAEIEGMMNEPGFWEDSSRSGGLMKEMKSVKAAISDYDKLYGEYEDLATLIEMTEEDPDDELSSEAETDFARFKKHFESYKISTLLSGEFDSLNAILSLNAGAGGTESCDWAGMLYRMYTRWAERHGFSYEVEDILDGDEAGIKSVKIVISGENAYGYLKSEKGVHRLVRISPFNAAGKRQTSFVSCDVMPQIEDDLDVEISEDDIRIDTYRSSGAGGQHINKTSSAIRITHIPTGIVVQCQNERSQHKNKDAAMQELKSRLYLLRLEEQEKNLAEIRGEVTEIGWGNQIRSYVLQPYTMVKDHRTNFEVGNAAAVLDGDIDGFINEYLMSLKQNAQEA